MSEKKLKVGDPVSIVGGDHNGRTGVLTHIGTTGSCEVALTTPTDGETCYVDVWDFNVIKRDTECDLTNSGSESPIKDSGERTEFSSGAVRDLHSGKGDMLSIPWAAMLRVSKHYENGAAKYGRYNYLKGIPVSSFIDSALRHLAKYIAGWDDEDHLAAAAFNVLGAIQMEEHNPDMCDLPWREGKRSFHYEDDKSEARDSAKVSSDVPG